MIGAVGSDADAVGPVVEPDAATFQLPDDEPVLRGVRLLPALSLPNGELEFCWSDGCWRLRLPRPPVWRMEYRLQLRHRDGGLEEVCDPGNARTAPGAFGDKSVLEFPDYRAPWWLDAEPVPGEHTDLLVPAKALGLEVAVRIWAPWGVPAGEPLPMLVAHDGPEYDRLAGLTRYAGALIGSGVLPPHRVALLAPGKRNEEYSANPAYAHALAIRVLPALRQAVGVRGHLVGLGASLGALAMLHVQRSYPGRFSGLFLQSGSFFDWRLDPQERWFSRFERVTRFVADVRRPVTKGEPVPIVITCGAAEENLANNRQMTTTLQQLGYPARFVEVPDAHNYVGWRDAFDPALTELLRSLWSQPS